LRDCRPLGSHSIVALIPARFGSKRCPGKNTRLFAGKPLICHTIDLARACDLFSAVVVSTDDIEVYALAKAAGVTVHNRQPAHATDDAPDYAWVSDVMQHRPEEIFCLLRPTSPFRTHSTIRRAYARLIGTDAHSVRAVEKVSQHPGKMWIDAGKYIIPMLDNRHPDGTPWHSSSTQSLPPFYVQNASLEIAWTWVLRQYRTISGEIVSPLLTDPVEGFDINTEADFAEAERLAQKPTHVA
jgi:CMP-N,N'-diacetyllegionaminic acid synthase